MNGSYEALFSSRRCVGGSSSAEGKRENPGKRPLSAPPMPRSSRPPGLAQPRRGGGRGPRLVGGAVSGGGRGPGQWAGRSLAVGGARRGHGGGSALAGAAVRAVLPLARPGDAADRPAAAAARRGLPARREYPGARGRALRAARRPLGVTEPGAVFTESSVWRREGGTNTALHFLK